MTPTAYRASEVFLSGISVEVMPVVGLDGNVVGDGRPGPVAKRLRQAFHRLA